MRLITQQIDVLIREFENHILLEQHPHSSSEKIEAEKSEGTCPMSPSQHMVEPDLKPRSTAHIQLS